ncbi:MAG: nucleotidyltransferase domain-containing protein [Candidatus Bathyarchaeia archaeon]
MSSEKLLVREAKRRAQIFRNIDKYLKAIGEKVKKLDKNAEAYLFGSVAEGKHLLSSDIDILVVTDMPPAQVIAELGRSGITDPFEIHAASKNMLELYKIRAKLIKITE